MMVVMMKTRHILMCFITSPLIGMLYYIIHNIQTKPLDFTSEISIRNQINRNLKQDDLLRYYKDSTIVENMDFLDRPVQEIEKHTYKIPTQGRCAILGNGGILLNSSCGDEINANDYVIRLNIPDIDGYTRDVGYKTNLTTVNLALIRDLYDICRNGSSDHRLIKNLRFLNGSVIFFTSMGLIGTRSKYLGIKKYVMECLRNLNINVQVAYSPYYEAMTFSLKRMLHMTGYPTVGLTMLTKTIQLCNEVTAYGFYPSYVGPDGKTLAYHYYGAELEGIFTVGETSHNYIDEFELLKSLADHGAFRWVTGKCN